MRLYAFVSDVSKDVSKAVAMTGKLACASFFSLGGGGLGPPEPRYGRLITTAKEGAHGGNRVSPVKASAERYAGARSIWIRGSQPSQVGRYQFQRPSSFIAAGRITERISVASISRAIATPKPICWN